MKRLLGFLLLIFVFAVGIATAPQVNACGISDEIEISVETGWQAQAFEGFSESYKCTDIHEVTKCGNDMKIEDMCELKITDMSFVGIAGNTMANASLCRTGNAAGEGMGYSSMYMDVVIPLPFPCTWASVSGSSMSSVSVWAY